MREGWTYRKLGEVCEIEYGTRVVQARDGGSIYPVYGGGGPTFMMDSYNRENRVVISRFAMSKKCTRKVSGKFFLNDSGLTIKSKDPLILQNYLDTFVLSSNDKIYHLGRGLAQKNLKVPDLLQIEIAIPDAKVQQSIVAELDKINELISLKKAQLSDLDSLAQSIFYEMFGDPIENEKGWEVKRLADVCEVTSSKRIFAEEYTDCGIPFYRGKEITERSKNIPISVELYISKERYEKIKQDFGSPKLGDLLITAVGTIGNIWVVNDNSPFYFKDGNIIWIRNITNINSDYFKSMLEILIDAYKKEMARGAAYSALTIVNLKKLSFPLPPLPLQQEFAKRIELIEQQKAQISSTIKDLETLLASRMQYWFD